MEEVGTLAFKYWLEFLFGLLALLLTWVYKRLWKRTKAINGGVQALLRDRIIQAYNHYQDKGYCPIHGLENVQAMFTEYKALGGNGTVERLVDELKSMPRSRKE